MKEELTQRTYKKKYLKGLLYIKVDFDGYKAIYRLFGIKIASATFYCGKMNFRILGFIKFSTSLFTKQLILPILVKFVNKKTKKQINDSNDIIGFFCRAGETFLMAPYLKSYFFQNSITNPVVISPFIYLKDIFKMYYPELNFIKVPKIITELQFLNITKDKLNNSNYYQILNHNYFTTLEKSIQKGQKKYFYDEILNRLNVTQNNVKKPLLEKNKIEAAKIKFKKLNITNKYIYIAPAAQSNGSHSKEFWENLELELFNLGYDIIWNTLPEGHNNAYNKYCNFTLQEAAYVASFADYVIGVRSGLLDILSYFNSNIFCTYFPFLNRGKDLPEMSADKVLRTFTLKKLPFVSPEKIVEFNGEELDENEILETIIKTIKIKNGENT